MYFILLSSPNWKYDPFGIVYGELMKQWFVLYVFLYFYSSVEWRLSPSLGEDYQVITCKNKTIFSLYGLVLLKHSPSIVWPSQHHASLVRGLYCITKNNTWGFDGKWPSGTLSHKLRRPDYYHMYTDILVWLHWKWVYCQLPNLFIKFVNSKYIVYTCFIILYLTISYQYYGISYSFLSVKSHFTSELLLHHFHLGCATVIRYKSNWRVEDLWVWL